MKNVEKYNQLMKYIDELREYNIPQESSINAENFLKGIPENIDNNNKCIINDEFLLKSLVQFKYITKKKEGVGYVPKKEYLDEGLLEVNECFIITKGVRKSYTLLFTPKGQAFFKNVVLKLIDLRAT